MTQYDIDINKVLLIMYLILITTNFIDLIGGIITTTEYIRNICLYYFLLIIALNKK